MAQTKIIASALAENTGEIYKTALKTDLHLLVADEPPDVGGNNDGPAPGEYLCMALASCKVITLRMYAERKKWNVPVIKVKIALAKGTDMESGNNTFSCEVEIEGDLTAEQKERMLEIAKACPIDKLLRKPNDIVSVLL